MPRPINDIALWTSNSRSFRYCLFFRRFYFCFVMLAHTNFGISFSFHFSSDIDSNEPHRTLYSTAYFCPYLANRSYRRSYSDVVLSTTIIPHTLMCVRDKTNETNNGNEANTHTHIHACVPTSYISCLCVVSLIFFSCQLYFFLSSSPPFLDLYMKNE